MNTKNPYKVLILCTGNSARSIIGEQLLRAKGKGRFEVHSAGVNPAGHLHPLALRVLQEKYGIDAVGARSKSWREFIGVKFEFVITVCDAAREQCPIWPGQPLFAHWGSPDPAAVEGPEELKWRSFVQVASQIARRADFFCAFPDGKLFDSEAVRGVGREYELDHRALALSL